MVRAIKANHELFEIGKACRKAGAALGQALSYAKKCGAVLGVAGLFLFIHASGRKSWEKAALDVPASSR